MLLGSFLTLHNILPHNTINVTELHKEVLPSNTQTLVHAQNLIGQNKQVNVDQVLHLGCIHTYTQPHWPE